MPIALTVRLLGFDHCPSPLTNRPRFFIDRSGGSDIAFFSERNSRRLPSTLSEIQQMDLGHHTYHRLSERFKEREAYLQRLELKASSFVRPVLVAVKASPTCVELYLSLLRQEIRELQREIKHLDPANAVPHRQSRLRHRGIRM